jgi:myo-inositol-1(or 4)-monophosphatase
LTSPTFWQTILEFSQTLTTEVGHYQLRQLGQTPPEEKADGSLVTECDRWSDDFIRGAIARQFPDHGVLSEEVAHHYPGTDWCWIIDPIDGTTNFSRGIPLWGISLGLLYQGTPVFGYVAIPPLQQGVYGYWQAPNHPNGAFLDGHPLHTRPEPPDANQCFSLCARSLGVLQSKFPCKIRMLGVASYNLLSVALGTMVGAVEATPKIWDIAGVWPILQGAGGVWVALDDQSIFPLVAGEDYGDRAYPTLVVNQVQWVEQYRPLVQVIVSS